MFDPTTIMDCINCIICRIIICKQWYIALINASKTSGGIHILYIAFLNGVLWMWSATICEKGTLSAQWWQHTHNILSDSPRILRKSNIGLTALEYLLKIGIFPDLNYSYVQSNKIAATLVPTLHWGCKVG